MSSESRAPGGGGQAGPAGRAEKSGPPAAASAAARAPAADVPAADVPATGKRRVLIVEDDTLVGMGLRSLLERLGHDVVGQASTTADATTVFRAKQPDVVLMDIRLDGADGIELAKELLSQRRCPMIIISAFSDRALIERASAAGVFGYLIKPVTGEALAAQLEVAARRFRETEELHRKNLELSQTLENRKAVERAKGIFMKRLHLDEPEAHRRLQQESQKRRISIAELAKKIIESEELLGG
jgi:AmiR/NasT family two-component response regulator